MSTRPIQVRNGIVTLSGYGITVKVEYGQLYLHDGIAEDRREGYFSKATCGIRRLVILGHSGIVSLDALKWLSDVGAGLIQIDWDGEVLFASTPPSVRNSLLRRAQALAPLYPIGPEIVQHLLERKLNSQARLLRERLHAIEQADSVSNLAGALAHTSDMDVLRAIEAQAATFYWQAWADVSLQFARRDNARIPDHWRTFGSRTSALTRHPYNASNPANAILNYLYALLESEARIALIKVGLDPGLGFMHVDQANRDSLAYDVMEPVRCDVDTWFISLLRKYTFTAKDFYEKPEGGIRLTLAITPTLAETTPMWEEAVAPFAEWIAEKLLRWYTCEVKGSRDKRRTTYPTPLTQAKRSQRKERAETLLADSQVTEITPGPRKKRAGVKVTLSACRECGRTLTDVAISGAFCSDACREAFYAGQRTEKMRFQEIGPATLKVLRESGINPAHSKMARKQRSQTFATRVKERKAWEAEHGKEAVDREMERFRQEILPRLADVTQYRMAKVTGLSKRYCALIKRGEYIPHPVHHEAFRRLIAQVSQQSDDSPL